MHMFMKQCQKQNLLSYNAPVFTPEVRSEGCNKEISNKSDRNDSFYDEWYKRKKVLNELITYFNTKRETVVVKPKAIEMGVHAKKLKKKRKKKDKHGDAMNVSIDELWTRKSKGKKPEQINQNHDDKIDEKVTKRNENVVIPQKQEMFISSETNNELKQSDNDGKEYIHDGNRFAVLFDDDDDIETIFDEFEGNEMINTEPNANDEDSKSNIDTTIDESVIRTSNDDNDAVVNSENLSNQKDAQTKMRDFSNVDVNFTNENSTSKNENVISNNSDDELCRSDVSENTITKDKETKQVEPIPVNPRSVDLSSSNTSPDTSSKGEINWTEVEKKKYVKSNFVTYIPGENIENHRERLRKEVILKIYYHVLDVGSKYCASLESEDQQTDSTMNQFRAVIKEIRNQESQLTKAKNFKSAKHITSETVQLYHNFLLHPEHKKFFDKTFATPEYASLIRQDLIPPELSIRENSPARNSNPDLQ